jgi:inosose dehydratase
MSSPRIARRRFLSQAAALGGSAVLAASAGGTEKGDSPHLCEAPSGPFRQMGTVPFFPGSKLHIASNQYQWGVFYQRQGRDFNADLDAGLAEVAKSGMDGFEPGASSPAEVRRYAPLLKKHGLEMRSLYVGSTLHVPAEVDKNIANVLATAEEAKAAGTRIIVTNPSPLRWGGSGPQDKNDAQLKVQAAALDRLGAALRGMGLVLAYHNHDMELRNAAREFHHMLLGTGPRNLSFCLDAHWVYRGSGNSAVALFDVLKLYGPRVVEIHLRQSAANIWTEAFGDGDIDYRAMAKYLHGIDVRPHLVLEQCPEKSSPNTMDAVESHRRGRQYAAAVFAEPAG